MANATMQALQTHAEKLNQQVAEVNASIKALGDVPDDSPALQEYRKQLRRLNSDLKDVNTTMKDYTRGVKAAGELYRHYAMGNIEDMSIKAIRAGVNGMKKRLDNLKAGGDPGDAEEMRLIEAITTEADVVVKRFKTDYQNVVEEIARGGTVTEQTLKRTRDGLADLMQTAETEAEKNELTNYWQKVGAAIEAVAVENRRLRGEVADREEAMRIAYATDHDGSQQAISDAEARADAARRENDELRQRLDLKQQQRRELEQEMDINSMQVRSLMDRRDELKAQEKEDRAIRNQRVDDANKEVNDARRAAKTQQQAYDEQKQTVEKLRTEVQGLTDDIRKMGEVKAEPKVNTEELTRLQGEYNQKVERRKQLEQELQAIQTASYNDDPKVKQLKAEIEKIEELIAVSDKYRKQFTKMSDEKFDEGFKGKDESRRSIWEAQKYLDDAYNDKLLKAPLANMDLPDADKYKDAAKRVAEGIVQNAQENVRRVIFEQIKDGRWTPEVMEENLQSMRNMMNNAGNSELGLKDNPEYQAYKYIVAQMEKYLEVAKQVQVEREKIAGSEPFLKATQQDDYEHGIYPEGLSRQAEKREYQDLTGWRSWKAENDDREGRKSTELAKAQDEESESLGRLNKAKKESAEQTSAQSASSEQLAQKQEQLSQKTAELNQQQDKLNGMVDETVTANQRLAKAEQEQTDARNAQAEAKKHEGEAVKKVEDELRGLTDEQLKNAKAYSHLTEEINTDTAAMQRNITTEQEATREADRLRSGSIDKMEQALARLRESNRKLDPTIDKEEWERGERAIGQITLRLEELKKQSAELRREPVLDMMTQRMQSLGTLSRDALTETKKFWETMVAGAEKGSGELADYEQHLKSIALEEQARVREQGREAFAFFQREDYRRTNAANTEEQHKALVAYRDALPADATDHIEAINAMLEKHAQFVKEAAGEWMSLEKAMELASKAGTDQFAGSAKDIQLATQSLERQRDTIIATIREKRNLGQATKAEEDQLADLTKKLRSLKFEQDNVNMSQEKMRTLIETPANAVNLDELRAAIKRADGQLRQMQQSLGENSSEYKIFADQVRNAKNVLKEMEGQAKASATAWEKAFSRLKTYVVMYMGFNEVWQKVTGTMGDMLELSDKMGEVMKTTGFTADQVARLSDNLKDLDTRTPMVKLMELSSIAGSIGLKTQQQVEGFTDAANQLMVALPEMGTEAARTLMKIADATGDLEKNNNDVRETLERVGSTIIALRANSAAAAGPITDFVSRVGAVGAQAGISIDQIAALGATVDALGGRVEMSATALSRMIPAIRNNSFAVANAIGMTEKELKGMTAMEQMVAIFKALRDSVKQFDTSTDEGMNAMADKVEQMLGNSASMQEVMKTLNQQGARAGIVFGLLSQNVDKLEEQLTTATGAYEKNTALMEEYNKMNDTAAARWERLKNQLEEFWVTADNTSVLAGIIDGLRVLVDFLTEDGPLGRFFRWSLVYLGMWQAGWTKAIGTALISLHQYIFATTKSTAATTADTAAKTANTAATEAQAVASTHAATAQGRLNATMKANIIAAVATAVVALGFALYEYVKKAKAAARQTDVLADVEKKAREESVKERAELERLYKATQDQTKSMEERKKALKDMVGDAKYKEYYSKLNTESELAKAAASAYKELSEQIIATARARALDAKAEELQRKRIELEDKKTERQQWREENQGNYDAGKREYRRQQDYVGSVTGGATAGFQESQIAQRGSAAAKPAIIDQFEGNIREINKLESDISQVDADLEKVKKQVEGITGIKGDASGDGNGGGGGGGGTNPYGDYNKVTSPYKDWNGNDLVARRKEMLERVKALANGADVQAVLSEDAKFISDAVRKNIKTTEQAIEWYNTERLKIQEALHGKHLTNTGDWQDPEKVRKRAGRVVQDEMKYYLDELDAYYTERKTRIEQARNDEEITEGEAWRRTIQNDNEWQTRRAELQLLYSRRASKVTEDEMQAIFGIISERTGETVNYIKADIAQTNKFIVDVGKKSKAAMDRIYGDIELGAEKSYLKAAQAIGKQMKFIEDTLAKERPYDGITKNLQDNLDKMGVLAAKYRRENEELARQGKEPKYSNEQITAQSYDEMAFYLRQAADAYSIDIDELLRRMVKEGMTATAEEISKSDMLKQAVMGQLRKTYQEVQDAVKKEASQIKKDVEIIWNDDARGIGGMSMKATFDKALAQLGMQQDSVSRANSLIGAGAASDNVASRLAMKQIEVQMRMQKAQYDMYRVQANQRMAALKAEAEEHRRLAKQMEKENHLAESKRELLMATNAERDAENVRLSLGLTLAEETKKEEEQKAELLKIQEESQNRLYTSLREWAGLLTSSLQGVMEASHAGDAEYYNELAKLDLTGKGGPGAGTYVVIDDAGTSDATAHYEYLDERQALERQHEIEIQNAQAEAWKKLMDDLNMKMSEQITDWMNAALQDAAVKDNTDALLENTRAIYESMGIETGEPKSGQPDALPSQPQPDKPSAAVEPIAIPRSTTTTEAPKVAATDSENTSATNANTAALNTLTQVITGQTAAGSTGMDAATVGTETTATAGGDMSLQKPFFQMSAEEAAAAMEMIHQMWQTYNEGGVEALQMMAEELAAMEGIVLPPWQVTEEGMATAMERMGALWQSYAEQGIAAMQQMSDAMAEMPNKIPDPTQLTEDKIEKAGESMAALGQKEIDMSNLVTQKKVENKQKEVKSQTDGNKKEETSTQSSFAKMATAANMYGIAYQTMSNDNLSTAQKFQVFALQAAGQAAISMLTMDLAAGQAKNTVQMPGILGKLLGEMPYPAAIATFAGITALMGGLMALAMSSVTKSKSQIAQVSGTSVGAGRLATGMLTYAEGNVNELTDPDSLTPGRQYNVDGADGKTYRARYMGKGAKTHITNGPEFHLVGEAGREAIIDAKTTRLLQMNETGIWRDIQTLYNGGSISGLSTRRRRGTGMPAFADGNIGEFEGMADGGGLTAEGADGMGMEQMLTALDRNSAIQEALLERLNQPIYAQNILYGPDGLPNVINKLNKEAQRHGEEYL